MSSIEALVTNMGASMKNMETQIGQIAEALQKHEKGKFPSQSEQAKAMTVLRSGRILDNGEIVEDASEPLVQDEEVVVEDIGQKEEVESESSFIPFS